MIKFMFVYIYTFFRRRLTMSQGPYAADPFSEFLYSRGTMEYYVVAA